MQRDFNLNETIPIYIREGVPWRPVLLTVLAIFVGGLLVGLIGLTVWTFSGEGEPPELSRAEAEKVLGKDMLAAGQKINATGNPDYIAPPTTFRAGDAKELKNPGYKLTVKGNLTEIKFNKKTQIPMPTICNDTLYVSGGFGSVNYYAFNILSGKLLWATALNDLGPSTAACAGNAIIINTESCTIFALDGGTGKLLWSHYLGDPLMSTPTVAGERIFTSYPAPFLKKKNTQKKSVGGAELARDFATLKKLRSEGAPSHVLVALEARTGKILWQRWIDSDILSAPVAHRDFLYAATFAGTLYKFRQSDGAMLYARQAFATSAPVIIDDRVYFTKRDDRNNDRSNKGSRVREVLVSLTGDLNNEWFRTEGKLAPYLDLRVQKKSAYAREANRLDAANGFSQPPFGANADAALQNIGQSGVSALQVFQGSRPLAYGDLNINVMGDEVRATQRFNGRLVWRLKLTGNPDKSGGFLFISTLGGVVLQVRPENGAVERRFPIGAPLRFPPLIHKGRLILTTRDGRLLALDTGNPELTGWNTLGGNSARTGLATH